MLSHFESNHPEVLVASAQEDGTGSDVVRHYNINTFPTMRLGTSVDNMHDYNGDWDADAIIQAIEGLSSSVVNV